MISPLSGSLTFGNLTFVRGILAPYINLLTNILSPGRNVGTIEEVGILKGCTMKVLIISAIISA